MVLTYCSIVYNLILHRLIRTHAFAENVDSAMAAQTTKAYRVGLFTYASAMLIALIAPVVSFAAYLLITFYYLIPRGFDSDSA